MAKKKRPAQPEVSQDERLEQCVFLPCEQRQVDTLETFVDAARVATLGPDHIHEPPWRERSKRGALGPWYGPAGPGSMDLLVAEYHSLIHGGGLWDPSMEPGDAPPVKKPTERSDAKQMRDFVNRNSAEIPDRQLEAYLLYYDRNLSLSECGAEMGITRESFYNLVKTLRISLRGTADVRE